MKKLFSIVLAIGLLATSSLFGVSREAYLDLMDAAVSAYDAEHIQRFVDDVKKRGLREHGFGRLAANLGVLISHGRQTDKKELLREAMDEYCRQVANARNKYGGSVGNDFSVKEVVACILELEKSGVFPKKVTDGWRKQISAISYQNAYTFVYPYKKQGGTGTAHNWAVFAAASEQARIAAGMGGSSEFVEKQIASQLPFFDENGMYRDPGNPFVYDSVTRLQFAYALHCGYDGQHRAELERHLMRSALPTLWMQSATGEIPYGGRSNQFLHNETFYAALCEWYATYFKGKGDLVKAQAFRAAARRAVQSLKFWLGRENYSHVKNRFPRKGGAFNAKNVQYGCEKYAYFDKYMVTMGSWAYLGFLFADETIPDDDPADIRTPQVFSTSDAFHYTFLKAGGYGVQFDSRANKRYDADGIGRIQREGCPPILCLSTPFTPTPVFRLNVTNETPLAFTPGWRKDGRWHYAYKPVYKIIKTWTDGEKACAEIGVQREDGESPLRFLCTVSADGVELTLEGDGELALALPVLIFDGEMSTAVTVGERRLNVTYLGTQCKYETNGELIDTGRVYGNRNGHYNRYEARGRDKLTVRVSLTCYNATDCTSVRK